MESLGVPFLLAPHCVWTHDLAQAVWLVVTAAWLAVFEEIHQGLPADEPLPPELPSRQCVALEVGPHCSAQTCVASSGYY